MQNTRSSGLILNDNPPISSKSWILSKRQLCDLECLLTNVYAPLNAFLDRENYDLVCETMRLKNGVLYPMPITLDVTSAFAAECEFGEEIILANENHQALASMMVNAIWKPNKKREAEFVYGTLDNQHPGVATLFNKTHDWYLGGTIKPLQPIIHYDFLNHRHTPETLKQLFKKNNWSNVVAIQTENPLHCGHIELLKQVFTSDDVRLLIHSVIGTTLPGHIDPGIRIKCYENIMKRLPSDRTMLSVIPMSMRMAGPREALWHTIIQKNYGVTQMIIGKDHANPEFEYLNHRADAQVLCQNHAKEIGIDILAFPTLGYQKTTSSYVNLDDVRAQETVHEISSRDLRRRLERHENIPDWYLFPDILTILKKAYPSKRNQGYTIFITGLIRTQLLVIAHALIKKILEANARTITLLDEESIEKRLGHPDVHLKCLGLIAAEITKHHGIALCVTTSPLASVRQHIREQVNHDGGFVEIYLSSPIQPEDTYQPPVSPEAMIDASTPVHEAINQILHIIESLGYGWCSSNQDMLQPA